MTDTDLITAGDSTEDGVLPNTVTADITTPADAGAPAAAPAADTSAVTAVSYTHLTLPTM